MTRALSLALIALIAVALIAASLVWPRGMGRPAAFSFSAPAALARRAG
jgi:hypothetical protein